MVFAFAAAFAPHAQAAYYKMVICSGNNGVPGYGTSTNTISGANPGGIFEFHNWCGGAGGDPPGENAFLRINENQASGNAGNGAYGDIYWDTPAYVHWKAAGGYTRENFTFNPGWRARFWVVDFANNGIQLLTQGTGLPNTGTQWAVTPNFAPHLWPFGEYLDFHRFVFELECVRPEGCERAGYNATDANGFVFILSDDSNSQVGFGDTGSALMQGQWVRGTQNVTWNTSDQGSGIRFERLRTDGSERYTIDYQAAGACDTAWTQVNGEWARTFQPCPTGGPWGRSYALDTSTLADGAHNLTVCTQDFGQYQGLSGTGGETCDGRTIHVDNTAPGAPSGLRVTSANPARYLDHFGAQFSLPPNEGSPIAKVHYDIVNASGDVVVPEQTVSATNPTEVPNIEGPAHAGDYRLHLWLEDGVGFTGPAVTAPIPHDTTPPAAPQDLRVTGPTTAHWVDKLDLGWRDITDEGSPIDAAHYQVLNAAGNAVGPEKTVSGENIAALKDVETPAQRGTYTLSVWLSDEEGNVGAPASVPIPRDTTPPAASQDVSVTAPSTSRATDGFDVRWRDIVDAGSPIDAVHYEVLDGAGKVAVPVQTVRGEDVQAIPSLEAPVESGGYTLRLWLSDAEGNVGAPASVPLAYDCVRSPAGGGATLSSGLGQGGADSEVVQEGSGSQLHGALNGANGAGVAGAPLCVFSRVVTDEEREFLGIALTGRDGGYRFAVAPGASRNLSVVYRPDQRELVSHATLDTVVHPTFKAQSRVVYNKHFARFTGQIPGPHNNRVVIVLQVRRGHGWLAFRRYRTREDGRFTLAYRFTRTYAPTRYVMRAQVRQTVGYPYLQGNSRRLKLLVLPHRRR